MTAAADRASILAPAASRPIAVSLTISGCVQGVGLRPAIARLASELNLAGEVCNTPAGVTLVLEGWPGIIESFASILHERLPSGARIDNIQSRTIAATSRKGFRIRSGIEAGEIGTPVPRDLAVCPRCLADVAAAGNRRQGYPFTGCTDCGPRYSIVEAMPFERSATTMDGFALCANCLAEYTDPDDRRFHAQTIACPECGPRCWVSDVAGAVQADAHAAIDFVAAALRAGQVVAVKGLGGYQLLADATSASAVQRLRQRKARPAKPLAVMVESLAAATAIAHCDHAASESLLSAAGPIVVVPVRAGSGLVVGIHPDLNCVGLMLPTTPLHWLLARQCPPLIATSGNREGEPLVADNAEALQRLAGIADWFLQHDRPIRRPIDDSVVRIIADRPVTIRAARGLAPITLEVPAARQVAEHVIAVGGQQKVAVALFNGCQGVLGPHVGDLDELSTRERFVEQIQDLCQLYRAQPDLIVHDAHPDYFTTRWAAEHGLPTLAVQHHHAHVVAGMVEHGWLDREVLGVAWDGTGYGPDGTIWGGEFLLATASAYRRMARLRPFPLLGGEAAVRNPWRAALAVLREAIGAEEALRLLEQRGYPAVELSRLLSIPSPSQYAPLTSSAGRLFDAVAAWLLPREATPHLASDYEGQSAMRLEAACDEAIFANRESDELPEDYHVPIVPADPAELDWRPLVRALVADCQRGVAPARLAWRFHAALADAIVRVAEQYDPRPVVLGGGVFQNRLLTESIARRFADRSQPLGLPGVIPPNDGGLAAGQLAVGLATLSRSKSLRGLTS
jgi:hydrogenase maturation protein HypF